MFGFMRPDKEAEEYRALYARGCQFLRREYGAIALPFHGYEAVFLYACSLDAGLVFLLTKLDLNSRCVFCKPLPHLVVRPRPLHGAGITMIVFWP